MSASVDCVAATKARTASRACARQMSRYMFEFVATCAFCIVCEIIQQHIYDEVLTWRMIDDGSGGGGLANRLSITEPF